MEVLGFIKEFAKANPWVVYIMVIIATFLFMSTDTVKNHIRWWMRGGYYRNGWVILFGNTFDGFFGKGALSPKFIRVSFIVSLTTVAVLYFWFQSENSLVGAYGRTGEWMSFGHALLLAVLINFIPDYLSFIESRWLLKQLEKLEITHALLKKLVHLLFFVVDIIATALLIFIAINLYTYMNNGSWVSLGEVVGIYSPYALFFYSTFITSVWMWVYFVSDLLMTIYICTSRHTYKVLNYKKHRINIFMIILTFVMMGSVWVIDKVFSFIHTNSKINRVLCDISPVTCKHAMRLSHDEKEWLSFFLRSCREGGNADLCAEKVKRLSLINNADVEQLLLFAKAGCEGNHAESCFLLGLIYDGQEIYSKAIESYQESLKVNSKDNIVYRGIGKAYYKQGRYDKAIKAYEKALELYPEDKIAFYSMGNIYYHQEEYSRSIEMYQKVLELEPSSFEACVNIGNAYLSKGDDRKAISVYQEALIINPKSRREVYNNIWSTYSKKREYNKAIIVYQKVLNMNSKLDYIYNKFGIAYYRLKRYSEAIREYQKSININLEKYEAYYNMGIAYFDQGYREYDNAVEAYKKAIAINPEFDSAYNNMGVIYFARGDYEKAIEAYQKALSINPEKDETYSNIGVVYLYREEYVRAIEAYKKAIDINPQDDETFYNIGNAYYENKEYNKAIEAYQKALKINPKLTSAYNSLIYLKKYYYKRLQKESQEVLDEVVKQY
jgi:tetratricopeptide (TPR) repeat protein